MEALEQLTNFFTTATETTMATGSISTDASYTRVKRDAPGPSVPNIPPRVKNSPTPVPALVVEYPKANEYKTLESS